MGEAKSYFFCGIGGSGMLPLALIVQGRGHEVAGSDRTLDQGRLAAQVRIPARARHRALPAGRQRHRRRATRSSSRRPRSRRRCPTSSRRSEIGARAGSRRPELLAELFNAAATGIAVGGTSGKSTVTGMIGWILHAVGPRPDGDERRGDEEFRQRRHAVRQRPGRRRAPISSARSTRATARSRSTGRRSRCSTTSRLDHKSLDELRHLFRDFAARAETVVLNLDDDETRLLAAVAAAGAARHLFVRGRRRRSVRLRRRRGAVRHLPSGPTACQSACAVPGRHNAENALAALAACEAAGVPLAAGRRSAGRLHRACAAASKRSARRTASR